MNWLFSIIRIAGASFPMASSLVQIQAEVDSNALNERIARLEDPVSNLHEDIPELSRAIYKAMCASNSIDLDFDDDFYVRYGRPLAILEARDYIEADHALLNPYVGGIFITDPSYIMYLCALEEDLDKMEKLISIVDSCGIGNMLDGHEVQAETELPLPVIDSVFEIFESKGYGECSETIGCSQYLGFV
ncbi:MAG: hypothetical protein OET90_03005 [Desulfuromonadales bacterium]|nr:hypothetical protein [Desulfuromonadales bacterium]